MIKLTPTAGTYAANDVIPLTRVFNTNPKFILNNNVVSIREPGFVEVVGGINYTATAAGEVAVNILVDGTVAATYSAVASAAGDLVTIPLYDLLRVIPTSILNGYATVSFTANTSITVTNGIITLKYIN